jgi:ATP-dependent exoDNAse (exonuclease V) beta subunit
VIKKKLADRAGLPRELKVVAPSQEEGGFGAPDPELRIRHAADARAAKARGELLHRGLEELVKAGAGFDPDAFGELAPELRRLATEPVRLALLAGARRVETEMPLVHRLGSELVHGTLDLLIEQADGRLVIVDYKTTDFEGTPAELASVPEATLRRFAEKRGYQKQLAAYARAVKAMHPEQDVTTGVYFTSLGRFVPLA